MSLVHTCQPRSMDALELPRATATGWRMMNSARPKRILRGRAERRSENAHKTGLSESEIRPRFWPAAQTAENVSCRAICPRFYEWSADSRDAKSGHVRVCRRSRLDDCLAVPRGELWVAPREVREKLLEAARRREIDVVPMWRLDRGGRSV